MHIIGLIPRYSAHRCPGLTTHTSEMKPVDPILRLVFLKCHSVAVYKRLIHLPESRGLWRSALILGSTVPTPSIATAIRSPRPRHTPHRPRRADRHPPLAGHDWPATSRSRPGISTSGRSSTVATDCHRSTPTIPRSPTPGTEVHEKIRRTRKAGARKATARAVRRARPAAP